MWSTLREIQYGDVIIVWMTRENLQALVVAEDKELNNKYGYYRHSDFVGVPYGSKVGSRNGRGFVHLLRPTPELWTLALPHRTQILYLADIAFVTSWLNIRNGSVVVEAGTGSGSFSHSTARAVGPAGHLYSYEFHETRASKAREEFERHGMNNVTLTHRNVCKDGFTLADAADAVFLDLPAPWEAIEHAKSALRKDRVTRICCFSPCMEQVLRTVTKLNEAGFTDVTMYETLLRPHDVSAPTRAPSAGDLAQRLRDAEAHRESKRLVQIQHARERAVAKHTGAGEKRKRAGAPDAEGAATELPGKADDAMETELAGAKRPRTASAVDVADSVREGEVGSGHAEPLPSGSADPSSDPVSVAVKAEPSEERAMDVADSVREGEPAGGHAESLLSGPADPSSDPLLVVKAEPSIANVPKSIVDDVPSLVTSKVFSDVRGHTSYLTFALLIPDVGP